MSANTAKPLLPDVFGDVLRYVPIDKRIKMAKKIPQLRATLKKTPFTFYCPVEIRGLLRSEEKIFVKIGGKRISKREWNSKEIFIRYLKKYLFRKEITFRKLTVHFNGSGSSDWIGALPADIEYPKIVCLEYLGTRKPNDREHFPGLRVESAILATGNRGTLVIDPIKNARRLRIDFLGENRLNSLSHCQATHLTIRRGRSLDPNILDKFATGRMETGSTLEWMGEEDCKTQIEEFLQKYPCDKVEGEEGKVNYVLNFPNGTKLSIWVKENDQQWEFLNLEIL